MPGGLEEPRNTAMHLNGLLSCNDRDFQHSGMLKLRVPPRIRGPPAPLIDTKNSLEYPFILLLGGVDLLQNGTTGHALD